ncbi:hypothetical protein [Rickettsia endosymbiont of Urophora cardui]|uniref:hypothetical protein n=1 Tax=Rickettsia endosymbiont of Urophora cardui TaxID=3066265 RepID=UPI00313B3129
MSRISNGYVIDYRHIIDSLVRKPGAFVQYQYYEALFPRAIFRQVYDQLISIYPYKGHKIYLKILQLAKMYGELNVVTALEVLLEKKIEPIIDHITDLLNSQTQTVCSVKINLSGFNSPKLCFVIS